MRRPAVVSKLQQIPTFAPVTSGAFLFQPFDFKMILAPRCISTRSRNLRLPLRRQKPLQSILAREPGAGQPGHGYRGVEGAVGPRADSERFTIASKDQPVPPC